MKSTIELTNEGVFNLIHIEGIPDRRFPHIGQDIEIDIASIDALYTFLGEKIAEMELEAGATPKTDLTEPH